MSNNHANQLVAVNQYIEKTQPKFEELAAIHKAVNFKREASFSLQQMKANSYLAQVAFSNPDSLKTAVLNVAAIGLSLNPVEKLCYLIPRNERGTKKVVLDISYRGHLKLAQDIGAIKWAIAEIVHENDTFELQGLGQEPVHKFSPFGDRGKMIGAYCAAKTHDGDFIVTHMSLEEIYSIRDRSDAWRAYVKDNSKKNPWVTDESEMIKKTLIKRAYKSWPMTDTRDRLEKAIDVSNESDPINEIVKIEEPKKESRLPYVREMLEKIGRSEEKFLGYAEGVFNREIKSLDDFTEVEVDTIIPQLEGFVADKEGA